MYDLIIIGGGPAGLTAGLYAGRARLRCVILEKMSVGGRILLTETIENFPGFSGGILTHELIKRMEEQVRSLGVEIKQEAAQHLDCKFKSIKAGSETLAAKAIIISTGAKPRKLGVPGEEKFTGRGVSYCAICDAPLFKGKDLFIVGGGNAVAEEALYLTRFSKSVSIVHRRDDLRASAILQEKLKSNQKIRFILSSVITEITGSHKVEGVKIKNLNSSEERSMACDGVFIYIGYEPDTVFLKGKLKLDEAGFIITDENMLTSEEGVFACGDCRKKGLYQVITACADGAVAADSAYKYLTTKE